jgi:hypothetical protein
MHRYDVLSGCEIVRDEHEPPPFERRGVQVDRRREDAVQVIVRQIAVGASRTDSGDVGAGEGEHFRRAATIRSAYRPHQSRGVDDRVMRPTGPSCASLGR